MFIAATTLPPHIAVEAAQADPAVAYRCPDCQAAVILKHGQRVSAHFAHLVRPVSCTFAGETEEHLWMKLQMRAHFAPLAVQLEVPLIPGHRADVVVPAQHLVIECQVSPIAIPEWERRTWDYQRRGYTVLWVWSPTRLGIGRAEQELTALDAIVLGQRGVRVAAEVLRCHQLALGRVYTLANTGQLVAVHLVAVTRATPGRSAPPLKVTRTLRLLPLADIPLPVRSTRHPATGTRLACLDPSYDWWHQTP